MVKLILSQTIETNTEIGNCSSDIVNNMSNKIVEVEASLVRNTVKNADKLKKYIKDSDDVKLNILAEELVKDEVPQKINEDRNDFIVSNANVSMNNRKLPKEEREEILVPNKKFKNLSSSDFKTKQEEAELITAKPERKKETNQSINISGTNLSVHSECFEDNPYIRNPDIIYNIEPNEHYKKIELLVEKNTTSKDHSLLRARLQISPNPQIKSSKKLFTAPERQNFAESSSNLKYKTDKDNSNKIMIEYAEIFQPCHAELRIAKYEENLNLLVDTALNYENVKKNNQKIVQSRSSPCFDSIDSINNSL